MWEALNEKAQLITEGENEETRNCQTEAERDKGWTAPSWREMKINVDASLNFEWSRKKRDWLCVDAKKVVDLVNSKTPNLSALGMLVEDIRKAMGSMNT
ncbi:uncharacterized protein G2W53_031268 [Senna tora]|uniref:Uncharacterized protein n=1 Tax=Senna tora TaxID=362788 RepID=A0A834T821_9FABA|nr:uncharacterized protein G2W53_031268 [Senna tora]